MGKMRLTKTQREVKKRIEARGLKVVRCEHKHGGHVWFHVRQQDGTVTRHDVQAKKEGHGKHYFSDPERIARTSSLVENLGPLVMALVLVALFLTFDRCLRTAPESRVASLPTTRR